MTRAIKPLMDFIPSVSPAYGAPRHLAPLVSVFERIARHEQVHTTVSVPPRHAKTDTLWHGIIWLLKQQPELRVIYVSYGQTLSDRKSRRGLALARRAHVPLDHDAQARSNWSTGVGDGGVLATSIGGPAVGEGANLLVIDDPHKNRVDAESALSRDRVYSAYTDDLLTRLEPGGSVITCAHRWHPDDLIGRLIADGTENITLPALSPEGVALWPERYSAADLLAKREKIGPYGFQSLYQGDPQARGGQLFTDVQFYEAVPEGCTVSIGVDFAYSTKSSADWSVAVVVAREPTGRCFVLDVVRRQVAAPEFLDALRQLRDRYGGAPLVAYIGGAERGIVDTFRSMGVDIAARPAITDKFTRAQPVAAAWSAGKVLVPRNARWLDAFVSEIVDFTGVGDRHDDQVDALAAAFDSSSSTVDVSQLGPTKHERRPWEYPLGEPILIVAGTSRGQAAAIVAQWEEHLCAEDPQVRCDDVLMDNPRWFEPRKVLHVIAVEDLQPQIRIASERVVRLARRHSALRVMLACAPTAHWKQYVSGFGITCRDATAAGDEERSAGRERVESLIRGQEIMVDDPLLVSELALLDEESSARVAAVLAAGRLDLRGDIPGSPAFDRSRIEWESDIFCQ